MIEFQNISFSYGKRKVLCGINLSLTNGQLVALIGENGSGKTTILRLAVGELKPDDGSVLVDSLPIDHYTKAMLSQKLSYFPQGRPTPEAQVLDTVALGRFPYSRSSIITPREDLAAAMEALESLGIIDLATRRMNDLSFGERQKVYLAMQMLQNTQNCLLDEPSNFLDTYARFDMMRRIAKMRDEGRLILCVIHDISLAMSFADRIVVIKDGNIVANASPEELYNNRVIEDLFRVRVEKLTRGNGSFYAVTP